MLLLLVSEEEDDDDDEVVEEEDEVKTDENGLMLLTAKSSSLTTMALVLLLLMFSQLELFIDCDDRLADTFRLFKLTDKLRRCCFMVSMSMPNMSGSFSCCSILSLSKIRRPLSLWMQM